MDYLIPHWATGKLSRWTRGTAGQLTLDAIIDRVRHNFQVPGPDRPAQHDVEFWAKLSQSRVAGTQ